LRRDTAITPDINQNLIAQFQRRRLAAGLALADFAAAFFTTRRPFRFFQLFALHLHPINCRTDRFQAPPNFNEWYFLSNERANRRRRKPTVDPAKLTGRRGARTDRCFLMAGDSRSG
jgi:hypothetical protein